MTEIVFLSCNGVSHIITHLFLQGKLTAEFSQPDSPLSFDRHVCDKSCL
jgi:hypothetical protein